MTEQPSRQETGMAAAGPLDAETSLERDRFVMRARPCFLYVMYAMILTSLPVGAVAAFRPEVAAAIARGMGAYLAALPEPLYGLFAAGYLGYTAARQWGKVSGSDR